MSVAYSYELIAPAERTDRPVAGLLPHLCREDRARLRAALPWRPARSEVPPWGDREPVHLRHGIAGLSSERPMDDE